MGGSRNTILHLMAAAQEGEVPFGMKDIDRLSLKVPQLCKGGAQHAEIPHRRRASCRGIGNSG